MKVNLAFIVPDDRFLVLSETYFDKDNSLRSQFSLVPYENENRFLALSVEAELADDDTTKLVTAVIKSVAMQSNYLDWIDLELDQRQHSTLGLDSGAVNTLLLESDVTAHRALNTTLLEGGIADLYDVLWQAPTPFFVLSQPDLRFAFANPAYSRLLQRPPAEELIGKPIRQVLSDVKGRRFFALMDQAMKTGVPYVGTEVSGKRLNKESGEFEEHFFDFTYHPLRNAAGNVSGLMVQVADVTDRVSTRRVSEHREAQLYAQWAELEAIYRTAPVGLALFDPISFRILRMNEEHAQVLRTSGDDASGRSVKECCAHLPEFVDLLRRAAEGSSFRNIILTEEVQDPANRRRSWLVNIVPALGPSGEVASLSSVFLDRPGRATGWKTLTT